jgi:hypothetical protein
MVRVFTVFEEVEEDEVLLKVDDSEEDDDVEVRIALEAELCDDWLEEEEELEVDEELEELEVTAVEGIDVVVDFVEDARSEYPPAAAAITITTITTTTAALLLIACLWIFMTDTRTNFEA